MTRHVSVCRCWTILLLTLLALPRIQLGSHRGSEPRPLPSFILS
jgi:hypothetical protein